MGAGPYEFSLFDNEELDEIEEELGLAPAPTKDERIALIQALKHDMYSSSESIQTYIRILVPGSRIRLWQIAREKTRAIAGIIVPGWLHQALTTTNFEGLNMDDIVSSLTALAPQESRRFGVPGVLKRYAAVWWSFCINPTRKNPRGGKYCYRIEGVDSLGSFKEPWTLSDRQINRLLDFQIASLQGHV